MSLAGELEAAKAYRPNRPRCTVCVYAENLTGPDQQAFADALTSDMMTTAIHAALVRVGEHFTLSTLQRHRNGRCRGTA